MTKPKAEKKKIHDYQILKVLGNKHRLEIVKLLTKAKELDVQTIIDTISASVGKISQPATSQHLTKLRKLGVLSARRDSRNIMYSLNNVSDTKAFLSWAAKLVV